MYFSIITINYNNVDGLRQTAESVISQTCHNYEWIIIDGGSNDGSKKIIEKYEKHLAYWCSEPDKGVYNAMNKGVDKAHGEYLLFLNSGDVLYDKYVLQQVESVNSVADIISGQVVRLDNDELLRTYRSSMLLQLYFDTFNHQGTFIHRKLFKNTLYDEELKIASDWKFFLNAVVKYNASVDILDLKIAKQDMTGISTGCNLSGKLIQAEERENVINEFFSPLLRAELNMYEAICVSPFTIYGEKLKKSRIMYAFGWRFLRFLSMFVK